MRPSLNNTAGLVPHPSPAPHLHQTLTRRPPQGPFSQAECEQYLGPNKFAAVQVSPPQEHVQGASWWTRYQPVSYLLAGRGGGPDKFAKMITRCNTAGVAVYVDVVLNHMAAAPAQGNATGTGGSSYGNRRFPDYAPEHFHHDKSSLSSNCKQGSDVSDRRVVQTCDSGDLPDLNTADAHVQQTQAAYLTHLTSLGVAGARIDSAKLIDAKELQAVFGQAKKPPPGLWFADAEVYQVVSDVVLPGEYTGLGLVGEFKFPVEVQKHFAADAAVQYLSDLGPKWGLLPSAQAVSFLDNQDLQRYAADTTLTYKDGAVYRIATLFMLAYGYGYPRLMSSYYFAKYDDPPPADPVHGTGDVVRCGADQPWVCEHRTPGVAGMVRWRIAAGNASVSNWQTYQGGNMIAFSRGPAFIAINNAVTAFDGQVVISAHDAVAVSVS
ncbi:hypothetical protein WJX72_010993 [[Myrmecia] bisecta]|uniref:Alpha-amylase n=1 Tax=[Myrmecia] bisecta TaxID=41462 RepID=A0AAW1PY63_9CHLO